MKLLKNKNVLIGGSVTLLLVIAIVVACICIPSKDTEPAVILDESTKQTSDTMVGITDTSQITKPESSETEKDISEVSNGGSILTPDESKDEASTPDETRGEKAKEPATPVQDKTIDIPELEESSSAVVVIGDGGEAEPYDCGVSGHHCDGPETHANIQNLELEGCPNCGSHSCLSFYATDEWGNTCYTPSKCPSYNIEKDPLHFCQACGKKNGDGTNGTCCIFVVDTTCPLCGKSVEAWSCHTCD
ncbi:MAG: hypothetical protein PHY15_00975 [Eubacteriales bacterium]|nr:hypothetical protein [Eubacteriales bacterium]MDD4474371.1 hypothetical protein [Eubacteriales bacterium]